MDNDKISRQALLNEINEEIEYGEEHFRPENEQINKGLKIARKLVRTAPTVEAITRKDYHSMTERFFDEFKENGADEETLAKCIFIGLAFGKLELMLFGSKDGDSDE